MTFNDRAGNPVVKSGSLDEVVASFETVDVFQLRWEPFTHTDANHPERGIFSQEYWSYGASAKQGCKALYSGIGTFRVRTASIATCLT